MTSYEARVLSSLMNIILWHILIVKDQNHVYWDFFDFELIRSYLDLPLSWRQLVLFLLCVTNYKLYRCDLGCFLVSCKNNKNTSLDQNTKCFVSCKIWVVRCTRLILLHTSYVPLPELFMRWQQENDPHSNNMYDV